MHLQPTYRLNQSATSITSATVTTSNVPTPTTHGLASPCGQHNVPIIIASVEVSPLPLSWSQDPSQGASHNQHYQQQNTAPLLVSPSGSGTLTGQQHLGHTAVSQ